MKYEDFIDKKLRTPQEIGIDVDLSDINPMLFDFQKDIVKWALFKGKSALFEGCGLGKTNQQLEWARHVSKKGKVLVLAPLAVSSQTLREANKFNIDNVSISRDGNFSTDIVITNYERLHNFSPDEFAGLVLDESSILKSFSGKTRQEIDDFGKRLTYKLACTATPSPNDFMEIGTHSEFINQLRRVEMLSTFFTHDGSDTSKWKIKGHALDAFWHWMASWCVAMNCPRDLGYDTSAFDLPKLNFHNIVVESKPLDGFLFVEHAKTLIERRQARRDSLDERVAISAEIANKTNDPVMVWCNLNVESQALKKAIPDAIEVKGSDTQDFKEKALMGFIDGKYRVLISKPSICGFGLNFQHANKTIFTGLSDSFEQMYQAIRRVWRYGQTRDVDCYIVTSDAEGAVLQNIQRKEKQSNLMFKELVERMKIHDLNKYNIRTDNYTANNEIQIPKWLR